VLERLAKANAKKVRIVKVDAYQNSQWAAKEKIRSVPTIQFYRKGSKVHEFSGSHPEHVLQTQIDQLAGSSKAEKDKDGNPIVPAIQPMPKEWMPPGVTPE
jgi:thioredoxin-like negative regulator of GroEL